LQAFVKASGVKTNLTKTQFYPIHYGEVDLGFITAMGHSLSDFPCTYLGLPLNTRKPFGSSLQPLVEKVAKKLSGWKRRFLTYLGRDLLVKSMLTVMPTHFLTIFKMHRKIIKRIDQFKRSFVWRGTYLEHVKGGHCLVNWETCLL
jgi:hypothetical protein